MLSIFLDPTKKWESALSSPLEPEDQLAYRESRLLDPTIDLSDADKAQIDKWMKNSENLPDRSEHPYAELTAQEEKLVERWMTKSESLPLKIKVGSATPFDYAESLWDRLMMRYYEWMYSDIQ